MSPEVVPSTGSTPLRKPLSEARLAVSEYVLKLPPLGHLKSSMRKRYLLLPLVSVFNQEGTAPWHYVNIEIAETQYEPDRHCPDRQCVVGQIDRFRETLADPSINPAKRHKALKYLIHFVGDLHQPLHAGQNHDRGGNDVKVEFLGQSVNPSTKKPWNLHQVWDHGLLDQYASDAKQAVAQIDRYLTSQHEAEWANGSVVEWAMQSHDQAREHAYTFAADKRLDDVYVKQALPVIEAQLASAGIRLAHVLNMALSN